MSFFDRLPSDILHHIVSYFDCKMLIITRQLSVNFFNYCETNMHRLLLEILHRTSKINAVHYTKQQLINLCKIDPVMTNISTGDNHSMVLKNKLSSRVTNTALSRKVSRQLSGHNLLNSNLLSHKLNTYTPMMPINKTKRNQIYAFGNNYYGQLGLNDIIDRNVPTPIVQIDNVISISSGKNHSLLLTDDGEVYAFGDNESGQLGLPDGHHELADTSKIYSPKLIPKTSEHIKKLKRKINWTKFAMKKVADTSNLTQKPFEKIIQISAGDDHSLALDADGEVFALGRNCRGQLGLGTNKYVYTPTLISGVTGIIAISGGSRHSLLLNDRGYVYAFGCNSFGQLGIGTNNDKNIPVVINKFTNNEMKFKKTVFDDDYFTDEIIATDEKIILTRVVQISAGSFHSLILVCSGEVYSFGMNRMGELGLGDYINRNIPTLIRGLNDKPYNIAAGGEHSLILVYDKMNRQKLYVFGSNDRGQLGLPPNDDSERDTRGLSKYEMYFSNYWMKDSRNTPICNNNVPNNIVQISAGIMHSLLLTGDDNVHSFGFGEEGQLGLGGYNNINIPTFVNIGE